MRLVFISACLILTASVYSQSRVSDSLKRVLATTSRAIDRFDLLNKLEEEYFTVGDGNIDSAVCLQMLQIAERLGNDSLMAISYDMIGNFFLSIKGDYSSALEYFFRGIPLAERAEDKRRVSSLYIDISLAYKSLDNPGEQLRYIRKAEEALPDRTSSMYYYMIGQVQSILAWYFLKREQPDSALHYARAMTETNVHLKSLVYEAVALSLSAQAFEKLGNADSAEFYFRKAIDLTDTMRHSYSKFVAKTAYIDYLFADNKIPDARAQARQLMGTGNQINNTDFKLAAAGYLRRVQDSLHRPDSAYYYSRLESVLRDSVYSHEKINKIEAMAFNEQIRVMEEETKRAAEEEQRRLNIQYALIALGITVFIILFLALNRSFAIHTRVIEFFGVIALLIVFEFLNLLLHPFLEKVTSHSPLLMLLALVCIAALLVPLHHKLQKAVTAKLIEKNKKMRFSNRRSLE